MDTVPDKFDLSVSLDAYSVCLLCGGFMEPVICVCVCWCGHIALLFVSFFFLFFFLQCLCVLYFRISVLFISTCVPLLVIFCHCLSDCLRGERFLFLPL